MNFSKPLGRLYMTYSFLPKFLDRGTAVRKISRFNARTFPLRFERDKKGRDRGGSELFCFTRSLLFNLSQTQLGAAEIDCTLQSNPMRNTEAHFESVCGRLASYLERHKELITTSW